jgi:hypothetical protein
MKMTIASTNAADPNWPTMGASHAKAEKPVTGRGHHHRPRDRSFGGLGSAKVGLDVFDRLLQFLDRSPFARAAHIRDLRQDVGAVEWEVVGQVVHLPRETPASETENREHQSDHRENGRYTANPTLQPGDRRSHHEREKDGDCERHEYGLCPVQHDNHEHTPGERHPGFHGLRRVFHQAQPFVRAARTRKLVTRSLCA